MGVSADKLSLLRSNSIAKINPSCGRVSDARARASFTSARVTMQSDKRRRSPRPPDTVHIDVDHQGRQTQSTSTSITKAARHSLLRRTSPRPPDRVRVDVFSAAERRRDVDVVDEGRRRTRDVVRRAGYIIVVVVVVHPSCLTVMHGLTTRGTTLRSHFNLV